MHLSSGSQLSVQSADSSTTLVATEEEMAAIAAAVQAYIALDLVEEANDLSVMSPWMVAGRLSAAGNAISRDTGFGDTKQSLWGANKLYTGFFALITSLSFSLLPPPALAQLDSESAQPAQSGQPSLMAQDEQLAYSSKSAAPWSSTSSKPMAKNNIRVCLASGVQKVDLDFPDGGNIYTVADGVLVAKIAPQSAWNLNLAKVDGKPNFNFAGKSLRDKIAAVGAFTKAAFIPSTGSMFGTGTSAGGSQLSLPTKNSSALVSTEDSTSASLPDASQGYIAVAGSTNQPGSVPLLGVSGRLYRGAVILKPITAGNSNSNSTGTGTAASTTSIAVINVLDLEDYLLSVVPSEVPSLWPKEVLKAQAIAARSYAVANLGKHGKEGYDVKATVDDQVYRGVVAEAAETNSAVADTAGLVLKNDNKVISAFFHSTSGGSTEVSENVWSRPLPYLKSVVDYDDAAPQFNWKKTVSAQALAKTLTAAAPGGENQTLLGVLVIGRYPGVSQRVKDVLLVGQSSARVISGSDLRRLFNLPSTQFSLFQSDSSYIFSGRGYGHGLGLSQWGAKALADNGYNAEQILSYYYKDVTIEPLVKDGAI